MKILKNLYFRLICNKFNYLLSQVILFVLVLTMSLYDTPEYEWGAGYIQLVSLVILCVFLVFRFVFLNFSPLFITVLVLLSILSIAYDELIRLFSQFEQTKMISEFMLANSGESIISFVLSVLVIMSLISDHKNPRVQ